MHPTGPNPESPQVAKVRRLKRVLVANRGEIAVRILRALADQAIASVAVYSEDDSRSLHVRKADLALQLRGRGASAYLDGEQIVRLALEHDCDAIHPGYGFLSERADFARQCAEHELCFIGPDPLALALLGDKVRARACARQAGVPVLEGSELLSNAAAAEAFYDTLVSRNPACGMVLKAVAGGGGRGMRLVRTREAIASEFERCVSEARAAFGSGEIYAEEWLEPARHIEVQIAGDVHGGVVHLFERECSLQRRNQKLVESAPAVGLPEALRRDLRAAALALAKVAAYRNLGTFEFLVDAGDLAAGRFAFIEANPRLQVEHTVTEAVTGIDLVRLQVELAAGASLGELGLEQLPEPTGVALQARVNMESFRSDGAVAPAGGILSAYEPPSGPGVRVDGYGYAGYASNPGFDSLLAKLIVYAPDPGAGLAGVVRRALRALSEFRIEGIETNLPALLNLLELPEVAEGRLDTQLVERNARRIAAERADAGARYFAAPDANASANAGGQQSRAASGLAVPEPEPGCVRIHAPLQGTLIQLDLAPGQLIRAGVQIGVLEAMKMEHVLTAGDSGTVRAVHALPGDTLLQGQPLFDLEPGEIPVADEREPSEVDLDAIRPDLAEVFERHLAGLDASRPEAVARRRKLGFRTARENLEDLVDRGSFVEYGALVIAAQRRRRPLEELIERTPADGLLAGLACINGDAFGPQASRCIVMSYDYTVLAGTQGAQNHRKKDRMFELAEQWRLPLVLFAEGGGGRPGDSDAMGVTGLDTVAFAYFGRLSGLVPLVGLVNGRCFAGNAALLGCCDVVIATRNSNLGMGGPAMIEGGGLGVYRPEDIGPSEVQSQNGVIDVLVEDEAEAVEVAKRYLSYFQGALRDWEAPDQRRLRSVIPENRLRVYDVRNVIEIMADTDSVLELRRDFGVGMVTALIRIEGRPLGVIANNPLHLAGAIDSPAADKAARFMQLCDAFDLPILFLCDTPGIMVGPEAERTGLVRHAARLFVTAGSLSVPFFSIVLRKGYGLGAQAMAGGSFKTPLFMVSWPSGEFGGMGLEGAVRLGFRRELEAIENSEERERQFQRMVQAAYQHGKAVNVASHFELDAVIDPMESRRWIVRGLDSVPPLEPRSPHSGKKRPCVDTW